MSFYNEIRESRGTEVVLQMKAYSKYKRSMAQQLNRRSFLLECRRNGLIPKFITRNIKNLRNCIQIINNATFKKLSSIINQVQLKILNLEIDNCHKLIRELNFFINKIYDTIITSLPYNIASKFFITQNNAFHRLFNYHKTVQIHKLQFLKKRNEPNITCPDNWFVNTTNIEIPTDIKNFLSLGPKFSLPFLRKDINIPTLLSDVEFIIKQFPDEKRNIIRAKATNIITNFIHNPKNNDDKFYSKILNKTRTFLKANKNLIITNSDKGNKTVILTREDYINKSKILLNDTKFYVQINNNPTDSIEKKNNEFVNYLFQRKILNSEETKNFKHYNSTSPLYYGLPKIHKENIPLRPIISCINSPTRGLSLLFSNILSSSFNTFNKFRIKDTFELVHKIRHKIIPQNYVLVSLDVISLFSNISKDLFLNIIKKHWHLITSQYQTISKNKFIEIISFIFENNTFKFEEKYYKQIFGTPMGSIISPIIGDIVINDLIYTILDQISFEIPIIYNYVDDLLLCIPKDKIDSTLKLFNSYNDNLKFTIEIQNQNFITYLDTKLIIEENKIIIDWHQKTHSSGRYILFFSNHPYKQKLNVVIGLKNRVLKISENKFHKKNLDILFNVFKNNGYPEFLLNEILYSAQPQNYNLINTQNESIYYSLPYIPKLSNKLSNILKSDNAKFAFKNTNTIGKYYTKLKDNIDNFSKSNVVYSLKCKSCNKNYIGQTSQKLKSRITQHSSDIKCKPNSCALSKHVIENLHLIDFKNPKILAYQNNLDKRLFLEMCYINNSSGNFNFKKDFHIHFY